MCGRVCGAGAGGGDGAVCGAGGARQGREVLYMEVVGLCAVLEALDKGEVCVCVCMYIFCMYLY